MIAACSSTDAASTDAPPAEADLVAAISTRLTLAVDVAETKWVSRAAIEDLDREAQAIAAVRTTAEEAGADPDVASEVLRAQIEASKVVQRALHELWTAERRGPFDSPRDLQAELRPELDAATAAMLAALADASIPIPNDRLDSHTLAIEAVLADRGVPAAGATTAAALALSPLTN